MVRIAALSVVVVSLVASGAAAQVPEQLRSVPASGARVCIVHLHGEERQALATAQSLQRSTPANLLYIDHPGRRHVTFRAGGITCRVDPNRVFTASGRHGDAFHLENRAVAARCRSNAAITAALEQWVGQVLQPAINRCRGPGARLPVVAFHNNTTISVALFRNHGAESWSTRHVANNPVTHESGHSGRDLHDFFLATQECDFRRLSAHHNAVWQAAAPRRANGTDDGSLSVAMAGERYVNLEAHRDAGGARNAALGREALQSVLAPCTAGAQQR
jgi:hypothetical protein